MAQQFIEQFCREDISIGLLLSVDFSRDLKFELRRRQESTVSKESLATDNHQKRCLANFSSELPNPAISIDK
ncbi:hypothetical protein M378DRAFT_171869 [Amanita muscaria Koide BX008]|uniref:Uncharacterized protein n=1 Tax=Amanita muscaria (strain Koide BX008) TaxID=946122 RepID=A0A0C2STJ1_AMAMK|nr:hypothetical protein M378DRAFT_171869 [Amanita muscaria Koide BX008]